MADVTIPEAYTITLQGGIDADLDNIHIKEVPPVSAAITAIPQIDLALKEIPPLTIAVTELPTIKLELSVKELPPIDLNLGIKPTRVSMPMNTHVCLKLLGIKLLDLSLCGENMVIIEPYLPRQAELVCR